MAYKKKTKKEKAAKSIFGILRAGLFLVVMIALFFLIVDQNNIPRLLRNNAVFSYGYDLKKELMPPKAVVEKEIKKDTSKGYTPKERETLDKIISKGAEDD